MTNQAESQWGGPAVPAAPAVAIRHGAVRGSWHRAAAALWITLLAATSCGGTHLTDDAAGAVVQPTLGHTTLAPDSDGGDADPDGSTATTSDDERAEPLPAPGPVLQPLSSAQQIKEAVEEAHGPTDDVTGQIKRFVAFPELATPAGAEITELRADVRDTLDGDTLSATAEVCFLADGTVEDVLAHYQTEIAALGWLETSQTELGAQHPLQIRFSIPDTAYELDDFTIEVLAAADGDWGPRTEVRLRYVELLPVADATPRQRLEGWAAQLPLLEGGAVTGAGIQTTSIGRHSLYYSLALRYEGVDAETVATGIRSLLPGAGYAIDPQPVYGDRLDHWVYLDSTDFDDALISTHQTLAAVAAGGPTTVNVDARAEFTPR